MKRPWTPGPWDFDLLGLIWTVNGTAIPRTYADLMLASKAPDMAELLIELVEGKRGPDGLYDIMLDAVHLLKDVGYDPDAQ